MRIIVTLFLLFSSVQNVLNVGAGDIRRISVTAVTSDTLYQPKQI
jgi:hypothetical protein